MRAHGNYSQVTSTILPEGLISDVKATVIHIMYDHATSMLIGLHCLPVKSRITVKPYLSLINASIVLHIHIDQHFSLPIVRHAIYALLISYFLKAHSALKSANDPSLVQFRSQGNGTNYPVRCANVPVLTSSKLHSRRIFLQIILTFDDCS